MVYRKLPILLIITKYFLLNKPENKDQTSVRENVSQTNN